MTRTVLISRSLEVSSAGFITIISIIQGVALALLAQNTFQPDASLLTGIQSAALLLVFVAVFYFYVTMSILLRWAPSFLDAFLPFVIASLEIPPAFFLGHTAAWCGWLSAFWIFTSGGIHINILWSPPSHFAGVPQAHRLLHTYLRELRLVTLGGGLLVGGCAFTAYRLPGVQQWCGMAGAAIILATIAMVVAFTERRSSQIHAFYGVSRPAFN